jgi:uncharacterized protein (TIGR00369 family)
MSPPDNDDRTYLVRWEDQLPSLTRSRELSGRDYLDALMRGKLPPAPIAALIGFRFTAIGDGHVSIELEPGERHYNPIGTVHGGIAATLLDSAMGCAVHSTLPQGRSYTTLEIEIRYIRAMSSQTGIVRAEGRVVHAGRRTAVAEGRVVDGAGKVYAMGTTTCLLFDFPPDSPQ